MMKKVLLGLLVFGLCSGTAFATDVNFSLDGLWDWGTLYNFDSGTGVWSAGNSNPYFGTTSQSLTNGVVATADGKEDSYGVLRVNKLTTLGVGATTLFDRATAPYELTALFYGLDDIYIDGTPSFARVLATGGHVVLYQDYAKNYNDVVPLGPEGVPVGGRYDITAGQGDGFQTVTDGTLVLDLTPRAITDPTTGELYTFENFFSFQNSAGFGSILFDVTGGAWASMYDTNTQNFGTDVKLDFSSFPNTGGTSNWVVQGTGNARGNVVPEPASMTLLGLGLAGLVRFRRKR